MKSFVINIKITVKNIYMVTTRQTDTENKKI